MKKGTDGADEGLLSPVDLTNVDSTGTAASSKAGKAQLPDPTYESAQKLARLSTIEVMTLVRRSRQQGSRLDSMMSGDSDMSESQLQIEVPPISRHQQTQSKLSNWRSKLRTWANGWRQRNIPKTFDQSRLGLQWTVCYLVSTACFWWPRVYETLGFGMVFIPISAVLMFDPTWGGNIFRSALRIISVVGCTVTALILFLPMWFSGATLTWQWRVVVCVYGSLLSFFWCYLGIVLPRHVNLNIQGIAATAGVFAMLVPGKNYVLSTLYIALSNFIGIIVGMLVFGIVFPKSARVTLLTDLRIICNKISQTLEPLIEFEAGAVHSESFFKRMNPQADVYKGSILKTLSKTIRQSGSRFSLTASVEKFQNVPDSASSSGPQIVIVDTALFDQFRVSLWKQIESIYTLLNAQQALLRPAQRERGWKALHRFPGEEYTKFYDTLKSLFYHVVSLYLVLDTQSVAMKDDSMLRVLGDRMMFAGVGVKLHHPAEEPPPSDEESDPEEETPRRRRWSVTGILPGYLSPRQKKRIGFAVIDEGSEEHSERLAKVQSQPDFQRSADTGAQSPSAQLRQSAATQAVDPSTRQSISTLPPPDRSGERISSQGTFRSEVHPNIAERWSPALDIVHPSVAQKWSPPPSTSLRGSAGSISRSTPPLPKTPPLDAGTREFLYDYTHHEAEPPDSSNNEGSTLSSGLSTREVRFNEPESHSPPDGQHNASRPPRAPRALASLDSSLTTTTHRTTSLLTPPSIFPEPSIPASTGLQPGRQLSMVSVLSSLSHQSVKTGAAIDDIINATPVARWVEVYGPLIGRVSKHVSLAIQQFAVYLNDRKLPEQLDIEIASAEEALSELSQRRNYWFATVQILFNSYLLGLEAEKPHEVREHVDEYLFKRWMGINYTEYAKLSVQARANFWEAFGNIQDRLSTTSRTLMGLLVELKRSRAALETFVSNLR
eukprot:Blabericola_migrator_1__4750@NODE_24_length_21460_cov_93_666994_g21_i0_p3_GENE_NODE_24_length_21460_cov_93_666994_g21_i0NODE_24_length_21460_cov_93_666994_g21_i0_p3_ORF_typecomplete_len946_score123_79ArAE_2_N/PF10337_9/4_4e09ALMT/PF11744_8/0_0005ArAE_1/PF06081_11/0_022FUSC_2/PF13515_6/0_078FUSC/PF04632_12/0_094IBN_N/PF03810_19/2e02IBN_N/PF03810_19/4_9_NODE_24_length_21460_cov_93_666994_g21_i01347416311